MSNYSMDVNDLHKKGRKELALMLLHGDLQEVIPTMASDLGITETAKRLSNSDVRISHVWVARWLSANGYRRVSRWERAS